MSLPPKVRARLRGFTACALFVLFNAGGLALSGLVLPFLWSKRCCRRIVSLLWTLFLLLGSWTRLFRFDFSAMPKPLRGTLIVANHPSLIDVLFFLSRYPNTLSLARHGLRRNPFLGFVVSRLLLPDDATLLDIAPPLLAKGHNLLIFPEGTRSPQSGGLHPFRRGAAQLALRTNVPILPVRITFSRRVLAKGQSLLDMGTERIDCRLTPLPLIHPADIPGPSLHARANTLTHHLEELLGARSN